MPSLFSAIDTVSSALQAFQQELNVTGNNIANVNTPGYSREVANLTPGPSDTVTQGATFAIGTGVQTESITRIQNMFLQQSSLVSSSNGGRLNAMQTGVNNIQSALNEPTSSGISSALSQFFNAWSGLAASPSDASQQLAVQTAAQNLVQTVSSVYQGIKTEQSQATQDATQTLTNIQNSVNEIGTLNTQIVAQTAMGATPNTLLDQRDQALQTLSGYANIQTSTNANGSVNVTLGGMTLVDQSGAYTVPTNFNAASSSITDAAGNSWPVTGGELGGDFGVINTAGGYMAQLDTLASTVSTQVNAVYATAQSSTGTTGATFFTPTTGVNGFALDPSIASSSQAILTGTTGKSGDGGVAQSLADLQNQAQSTLGNQSITAYYTSFVGSVGSQAQYYTSAVATQSAVTAQIQNQINSVSGVNTDDEMANMLQYQRSYQAAAECLSTINTAMDSLMAMVTNN